jgi:hypothetical protein
MLAVILALVVGTVRLVGSNANKHSPLLQVRFNSRLGFWQRGVDSGLIRDRQDACCSNRCEFKHGLIDVVRVARPASSYPSGH